MAILESGRVYPPGLATRDLIHVEARDARDALWAMEEGVRCACLSAVIGEIWGDPQGARLHRHAAAGGRVGASGTPCWLVRLGGSANLSGARMRWRIAARRRCSMSSIPARRGWPRGMPSCSGRADFRQAAGAIAHEADRFHLVAGAGDRALGEVERLAPDAPVVLTVEGTHGLLIHAVTKRPRNAARGPARG